MHFLFLCCSFLLASCATQSKTEPLPQEQKEPAPAIEFVDEWGTRGDGPGQLKQPTAIATDSAGNVFITDTETKQVHKFTPSGTPLLTFGDARIRVPVDIAVDSGGAIYVADAGRNSILVFFPEGDFLNERRGTSPAQIKQPVAVDVDSLGNIIVLDQKGGRLVKISSRGRTLWQKRVLLEKDITANNPPDIAVASDGTIYFVNSSAHYIEIYSESGERLPQALPGSPMPQGETPDPFSFAIMDSCPVIRTLHTWSLRLKAAGEDGNGSSYYYQPDPRPNLSPNDRIRIAASPKRELFLLNTAAARVYRYRVRLP